ncbi:hypothetical protein [Roseiflexus sp.]|uniref:hypothetical protein n=1 Tax=Roseiflexus sp. TaxID=2562120 RepID=UPI0021DD5B7B|nr:hypothetical protein [Roseiflexus sp.]GIW00094.1 MAG: hypothetical protein KatS3mg058_1497 [Roseiflexus sp.]
MPYAHEQTETWNTTAEQIDDIPILIAHMRRMGLPQALDRHIPTRAYWGNLSVGWTAAVWLTHLLSCSDHKPAHVQQWVETHIAALRWCIGSEITHADVGIDRLHDVLIGLSQDDRWQAIETDLNRRMLRAWPWTSRQVNLRLYEGRSWFVEPSGAFQIARVHPWRARTLRQSIVLATIRASNLPFVTWSFPEDHVPPVLFARILERISQDLPSQRLRFIGDSLFAPGLRGAVHMRNDEYLCPLPDTHPDSLNPLTAHFATHTPACAAGRNGNPHHLTADDSIEWYAPVSVEIDGATVAWNERRIAVRSPVQAHRLEEALRTRLVRAEAALLALVERKRGKRRPRSLEALREAAHAILDSYQVHGLLRLDFAEQVQERLVRRYRGRPTGMRVERDVGLNVSTDADALAQAIRRLGWQTFVSNIAPHDLSADRILAIAAPVSGFERLNGRPLSLAPHEVHTPELETGLVRLLALGLRTLALLETIARDQLIKEEVLSASDSERAASRTTGERLLDAFRDIMLTPGINQRLGAITPLSPLQQRVLHLVALSPDIYRMPG